MYCNFSRHNLHTVFVDMFANSKAEHPKHTHKYLYNEKYKYILVWCVFKKESADPLPLPQAGAAT